MTEPDLPADDDLMARLRGIATRTDPPPAELLIAARAAFATRRLDAELAELVLDSDLAGSGVRSGGGEVRVLSFASAAVSVELQVQDRTVQGLVSGSVGPITVETATGRHDVPVDEEGWFRIEVVASGPMRLRMPGADGPVVSAWVSV